VSQSHVPDPKLLDALAGYNAEANMVVVQRTRRSVMETANKMREAQSRERYQAGLVLLALAALLVFLAPTLWVIAEDVFNGERLLDASTLVALLMATTVSTIFAVVLAQWNSRSPGESA
jgi:succinate dehydrogenase hydrophobic anchor subunit